jgi:hypothetical protein
MIDAVAAIDMSPKKIMVTPPETMISQSVPPWPAGVADAGTDADCANSDEPCVKNTVDKNTMNKPGTQKRFLGIEAPLKL